MSARNIRYAYKKGPVRPGLFVRCERNDYAIAFFKFSSILSRKPVVESHF